MSEGTKLYSTREAADYLGYKDVKPIKVYAKKGILKGKNVGGKAWIFTKEQLDEFAALDIKPGPKPKANGGQQE